jgi:hypothetical protein
LREYSPALAKAADCCLLLIFHDIHSRGTVDRTLLMTRLLLAPIFRVAWGLVWEWVDVRE